MADPAFALTLPSGIRLTGLSTPGGPPRPTVLFLHGFPEAAFAWSPILDRLAGEVSALAPNLRGYADSSRPSDVAAYKPRHLVDDVVGLIHHLGAPIDLLVAHDWGGAVAWNLAAQHPHLLRRLLILNAPHPAAFLRELRHSPVQQAASAYMNYLCREDAAARLAEDDFRRLWALFTNMGAGDPSRPHGGWLTEAWRARYRAVWRQGLEGALNWYRASPLRPATSPEDALHRLQFPDDAVTVRVPTTVLWGEADTALPPGLLDGLSRWVPDLELIRVPDATHWIVHEQPDRVVGVIRRLVGTEPRA